VSDGDLRTALAHAEQRGTRGPPHTFSLRQSKVEPLSDAAVTTTSVRKATDPMHRSAILLSVVAGIAVGIVRAALAQVAPTDQEVQSGVKFARELAILQGKWVRRDGNYTIEVKRIDPSGKVDAVYSNPNPVKVSKAEASTEGGDLNLLLELQGPGYAGSTYTLVHDPKSDCMLGIYFHVVTQQKFAVIFQRGH
jgi:hypothetical protein